VTCAGWTIPNLGSLSAWEKDGAVVRMELGLARNGPSCALLEELRKQLIAYAHQELQAFACPWHLEEVHTPFGQAVLNACAAIPYASTGTYRSLAQNIGNAGAVRAVGTALGRNPLPILIPCHRVLATSGIGGYSGGLAWKHRLLEIEGSLPHSFKESMQSP
jgi:methylated-DNA-[protein]-cysteine S-methyltransferase